MPSPLSCRDTNGLTGRADTGDMDLRATMDIAVPVLPPRVSSVTLSVKDAMTIDECVTPLVVKCLASRRLTLCCLLALLASQLQKAALCVLPSRVAPGMLPWWPSRKQLQKVSH